MSQILSKVLSANQEYATSFGDKSYLRLLPGCHFAIRDLQVASNQ